MILLDYSSTAISAVTHSIDAVGIETLEFARDKILSSIRVVNRKFKKDYGELVICVDDTESWRKEYFPYYKENRKKMKEESVLNWKNIYLNIYTVLKEIKENFPYRIIKVKRAEGDDVMAALALNIPGKHLIVSKDGDMVQLTSQDNINVYSPKTDLFVKQENLDFFIFTHVVKGDPGDGITNVLSDDDTIITAGKRQKPVSVKNLEKWFVEREEFMALHGEKYVRNRKIISLFEIPEDITSQVIEKYEAYEKVPRTKIFQYLVKNKLDYHTNRIGEF